MDDLFYAANPCIAHEVVHLDASAFAVKVDRLNHRIKADLVAKLEAVGERLFRAVNAQEGHSK